jgi:hypothetical protein
MQAAADRAGDIDADLVSFEEFSDRIGNFGGIFARSNENNI